MTSDNDPDRTQSHLCGLCWLEYTESGPACQRPEEHFPETNEKTTQLTKQINLLDDS